MNNFKSFIRIISQLNYILDNERKRESIFVFLSMLLVSFLELVGVSVIYAFLQIIIRPSSMKDIWYFAWIYTLIPTASEKLLLVLSGLSIVIVFIAKNALAILSSYIQSRFATSLQKELSTTMLDAYMRRPYEFFLGTNSAVMVRGINGDVVSVYTVLLYVFQMVGESVTILFIAVYLLRIDSFIALSSISLAAVLSLYIVFGFKEKLKRAGKISREAAVEKSQYSYQAIMGNKEITVKGRRDNFVKAYEGAAEKNAKVTLIYSVLSACPDRILEGGCIGGLILIVCIRIVMGVDIEQFVPIMGTFAMGTFKILPSVSKIANKINGIVFQMPALQSYYDELKATRKLDIENGKKTDGKEKNSDFIGFRDSISLNSITFHYANSDKLIINQLNMIIKKGESVAFIGESGAGKTTLADIVMGLLTPQTGNVMVDGVDISTIPQIWSGLIGYVPQSVFLIDDTIRANVAFGIPNNQVREEQIWRALEQAQLKDFVMSLPMGLDTVTGERGVKISGGQRQRIAIARALYDEPEILVLDEATSALDNDTERAVMQAIDSLKGVKTLIIVAHRLSTIQKCDRIYEIKDGSALERDKNSVLLT